MQFVYTKILYICTGDIRDIMTNVYMAALHSRIDHMGPPPSAMGGNPFAGPCCPNMFSIYTPSLGMALAGAYMNAPIMPMYPSFCGFGTMPSLFSIAATTAAASAAPYVGTFGSLTMPQTYQLPSFNYSMPTLSTLPTFNFGPVSYNFNFSYGSSNPFSTESSSSNYEFNSSSKIKPGLLKGNLKGKEAVITQLCEKYNVDVALVLSIIGQESGFGTSNLAQHNNFMGYRAAGDAGKSSKGFGYFSTPEKGLEAAIRNISKYPQKYASKGVKKADMNNIDAIAQIYCEGSSYSSAIKNIYNKTVKSYLA